MKQKPESGRSNGKLLQDFPVTLPFDIRHLDTLKLHLREDLEKKRLVSNFILLLNKYLQ